MAVSEMISWGMCLQDGKAVGALLCCEDDYRIGKYRLSTEVNPRVISKGDGCAEYEILAEYDRNDDGKLILEVVVNGDVHNLYGCFDEEGRFEWKDVDGCLYQGNSIQCSPVLNIPTQSPNPFCRASGSS